MVILGFLILLMFSIEGMLVYFKNLSLKNPMGYTDDEIIDDFMKDIKDSYM